MSSKTETLEPPKARASAIVFRVGEDRPPVDTSMIPPVVGETIRLAFRTDRVMVNEVEDHIDRLCERAAGMVITPSAALRSLVHEGARSFKEKEKRAAQSSAPQRTESDDE